VKFTRRQVLIVTLIASLAAAGVLLRSGPTWKIELDVPVASTTSINVHRVKFNRGDVSFEAVIARMPRNGTKAKLVDLPAGKSLAVAAHDEGALLAINGSYFDDAFQPIGLVRIDGKDTGSLVDQAPLSGLVVMDSAGTINLAKRDPAALSGTASAFQAGPFLVEPGGKVGIHSSDGKAAERTIVAMNDKDVFVLLTTPVTLFDAADALIAWPLLGGPSLDRALNLDGGPSSGFVIDVLGSRMQRPPRGQIRNAIVFLPVN
jgi:hypothetical protein